MEINSLFTILTTITLQPQLSMFLLIAGIALVIGAIIFYLFGSPKLGTSSLLLGFISLLLVIIF